MARIVTGGFTTFNLATHLDPMTSDLYDLREKFTTAAYTGSASKVRIDASGRFHIGVQTSPQTDLLQLESGSTTVPRVQFSRTGVLNWYLGGPATAGNDFEITQTTTRVFRIDASSLEWAFRLPTATPTLQANQDMSFQLLSNTSLRILVKGSDGVTRSTTLTLS